MGNNNNNNKCMLPGLTINKLKFYSDRHYFLSFNWLIIIKFLSELTSWCKRCVFSARYDSKFYIGQLLRPSTSVNGVLDVFETPSKLQPEYFLHIMKFVATVREGWMFRTVQWRLMFNGTVITIGNKFFKTEEPCFLIICFFYVYCLTLKTHRLSVAAQNYLRDTMACTANPKGFSRFRKVKI
jgi:hypothetical protein